MGYDFFCYKYTFFVLLVKIFSTENNFSLDRIANAGEGRWSKGFSIQAIFAIFIQWGFRFIS